jgi:hypothetical protein
MNRRLLVVALALLSGGAVLALWPRRPEDPEARIRRVLDGCARAAEAREAGTFVEGLAPDFRANELGSRDEVRGFLAGRFFSNHTPLTVVTLSLDVALVGPAEATTHGQYLVSGFEPGEGTRRLEVDTRLALRDGRWLITWAQGR